MKKRRAGCAIKSQHAGGPGFVTRRGKDWVPKKYEILGKSIYGGREKRGGKTGGTEGRGAGRT